MKSNQKHTIALVFRTLESAAAEFIYAEANAQNTGVSIADLNLVSERETRWPTAALYGIYILGERACSGDLNRRLRLQSKLVVLRNSIAYAGFKHTSSIYKWVLPIRVESVW